MRLILVSLALVAVWYSAVYADKCTNYCKNNGMCKIVGGQPKCRCMFRYRGPTCEYDNFKKPKPTFACNEKSKTNQCNGGLCMKGTCLCKTYQGVKRWGENCQFPNQVQPKSTSVCGKTGGACLNDGYCKDNKRCMCKSGWAGPVCQYKSKEVVLCEDKEKIIGCLANEGLAIDYALYGRRAGDAQCPGRHRRKNKKWKQCGDKDNSKKIVQADCQNQVGCTLRANNGKFGKDPCIYNAKYLFVRYHCEKKAATWTAWKSWSECTASCDGGQRMRVRECLPGAEPADTCKGNSKETEACNTINCTDIALKYGRWAIWSSCDRSCGLGIKSRSRDCVAWNGALADPAKCEALGLGPSMETATCQDKPCATAGPISPQPQTFDYGPWSLWSACSASCGPGTKRRSRGCYSSNKRDVDESMCSGRPGRPTQYASCNRIACGEGGPAPFGYSQKTSGYCAKEGISLNFITLESCALACYQWIDCRGITYDRSERKCWPLKDWCDSSLVGTSKNVASYKKIEPEGFVCGLAECNDYEGVCTADDKGGFNCKNDPTIVGFKSNLALDTNCADHCMTTTSATGESSQTCKSFLWGPNKIQLENPGNGQVTYYSDKPNFLPCILFNDQGENGRCNGFRSSSRARYCIRK